jgi:exodeoxyribonuclease VII small subunit
MSKQKKQSNLDVDNEIKTQIDQITVNNLENKLSELEEIVRNLESGKLNLDEGLLKFQQGVDIYNSCKKILSVTEKRIRILNEQLGRDEDFLEND